MLTAKREVFQNTSLFICNLYKYLFTFVYMETKLIRVRIEDYLKLKERGIKERRKLVDVISMLLEQKEETIKAAKPNPTLKEKKVHPAFAALKEIYITFWHKYNNFEYRWNGAVDASALNRLIKTLEGMNESHNSITDLFEVIMDKLPDFYKDKSINAINKNINGIIADIKNGGNKNPKLHQDGGIYDWRK